MSSNSLKDKKSISRLVGVDDSKAGMSLIDKEEINAIIEKSSQNSRFHEKQLRRQKEIDEKIASKLAIISGLSSDQVIVAELEADAIISELKSRIDYNRLIVHIDLDAFFAHVEIRDNPELVNVPMAVGTMAMLSTSNYKAREFGVRAGMPGFIAKNLCPELRLIPGNYSKYRRESERISQIIAKYDPDFLGAGIDEFYLDVTDKCSGNENPDRYIEELRNRIHEETGLTASAGISCNTRLAKLCSDVNKPNGQFNLKCKERGESSIREFLDEMDVSKVKGIGKVSASNLNGIGIQKCKDLWEKRGILRLTEHDLSFRFLMEVYCGYGAQDFSKLKSREVKSVGHERTFDSTNDLAVLERICGQLCENVEKSLVESDLSVPSKLVIKLKLDDFEVLNRTQTVNLCSCRGCSADLSKAAMELIRREHKKLGFKRVRLLGIRVAGFDQSENGPLKRWLEKSELKDGVSCPVCGELVASDEDGQSINEHLDLCLLLKMLENENSGTREKERPAIKKRKSSQSGILRYFKKSRENE